MSGKQRGISAAEWIAVSVGFAIVLVGLSQMPKYWRGDLHGLYEQGSAGWWPFGESLRRGFVRTVHLGLAGTAAVVLLVVSSYLEEKAANELLSPAAAAAKRVAAGVFVLTLLLDIGIVLLNRPKALVPPPYRDEPGVLTHWMRRRRTRDAA